MKLNAAMFIILVALLVTLGLFVSCQPTEVVTVENVTTTDVAIPYEGYFVMDGMPCFTFSRTPDTDNSFGGITCDWSQWDGRVVDGKVVLPGTGR